MAANNRAVLNALDILDLLGQRAQHMRLRDIASAVGLPESTTYRLISSLMERDYVRQTEPNGPYSLGWRILTLTQALSNEMRLLNGLRPYLESVLSQVQQTVNLGVLNHQRVVYIECLTPDGVLALYAPPGMMVPVHATAMGKALLAWLPESDLALVLSDVKLERFTAQTLTTESALLTELKAVRKRGYAVDRGELHAGVSCVAAAVRDPRQRPIAAISVTAHDGSVDAGWEASTAKILIDTVKEAEAKL